MTRKFVSIVLAVVLLAAAMGLGAALAPRIAQAQSSNQNMRALIQSLVDSKQVFTISGFGGAWDVDGTNVLVSGLGDDFVCVSGPGASFQGQPAKSVCQSFGAFAIVLK